jgi:hypothetical protein
MRALACIALLLVAGCGTKTCKDQTVLVSLTLSGASVAADRLDVTVVAGASTMSASVARSGSAATGTLEIDFPRGFPSRQAIVVTVTASRDGAVIGRGTGFATLTGACASLSILVSPTEGPSAGDLGSVPDMSSADGLVPPGDMTAQPCEAAQVRCNPTNHSFEQRCDSTFHWQDYPCPSTPSPPVYACTEAKNRCVHTGWVEWPGSEPAPSARSFTTIADPSGKGEDIVKDNWTGLWWQLKLADAKYAWDGSATPSPTSAQAYCKGLSYGGYHDWRLPAPIELVTLLDRTIQARVPMVQLPFAAYTFAQEYWTSAPFVGRAGAAWYVGFDFGYVFNHDTTAYQHRVRCVR